ncbi:MAG TPA: DUF4126 domain-containing protein [Gemmatimonadaceae bacterium]|nr:DUF4126 domain-containing protein [Gemmatimonadaceae bacterium]
MNSIVTLVQAFGVAYAAGLNLYASVAVIGLAARFGWLGPLPGSLATFANPWVIAIAAILYVIEFVATLLPGVASAWETVHSLIRPPAAAALAAATAWNGDPVLVLLAALLGGGIAAATHTTKLGLRYAIDTSPEPFTNAASNAAELGLVTGLLLAIWSHPFLAVAIALAILVFLIATVRLIWRALRQVLSGRWVPGRGFLQAPRSSGSVHPPDDV